MERPLQSRKLVAGNERAGQTAGIADKEGTKMSTATVRSVTVIPPTINILTHLSTVTTQKRRVAGYARVSTDSDEQFTSYEAQVDYFTQYIRRNPEWEFVKVYADEGISGTSTKNRTGFNEMIDDAMSGKIDLIVTKSVSRFARNTVDSLVTIRKLKEKGVEVYFEKENIYTFDSKGELLLTIMSSLAQEESRSASENQKWRVKRNFEAGIPWDRTLLGYRMENDHYVIVPKEAEIVCRIYNEYLSGSGYNSIAKKLNDEGVLSRFGGKWNQSAISRVLSNYTYTGNLLLQKTFSENHITKRKMFNTGELPKYHAEDTHEAIIEMETFQAVQKEKERRAAQFIKKPAPKKIYPFTGLLVCGNCGKNYRRKVTKAGAVWVCGTFNSLGKAACASKQIPEFTLQQVTANVLGQNDFTHEWLCDRIQHIRVCNDNALIFCFNDGSEITRIWKDRSRSQSWTDEMKEAARQKTLERSNHNA